MLEVKSKTQIKVKKQWFDKDNRQLTLLSAPAILYLIIFAYLPMFGLVLAFKNYRYDLGILGSEWVGFKNFTFFFTSQDAWRVTRNTLGLNALFIITGTAFSTTLALLMFEVKKRFCIKAYQTILIMPNFISWVVAGYMLYAFLNPQIGFINKTLEMYSKEGVMWYSNAKLWPVILTYCNIWKNCGLSSIIYYGALMAIDNELFEAAELDGANKLQKMWHISIAEIAPVILTMTILSLGNIFRADFGLFYQLTRDSSTLYETTDVIDTYIFRALKTYGDIGTSSAIGFFQSVVGFIVILCANGIVRKLNKNAALF